MIDFKVSSVGHVFLQQMSVVISPSCSRCSTIEVILYQPSAILLGGYLIHTSLWGEVWFQIGTVLISVLRAFASVLPVQQNTVQLL